MSFRHSGRSRRSSSSGRLAFTTERVRRLLLRVVDAGQLGPAGEAGRREFSPRQH